MAQLGELYFLVDFTRSYMAVG
uniref:Uncharacterized protein n=1 Tax=Anguilla anguilla TaxID=7936 RepID=A0A0E9XVL7_ANGAN